MMRSARRYTAPALVCLALALMLACSHRADDGDDSKAARHALALSACPRVIKPYLFRIEKNGHTSYVLGTRHVGVTLDRMPDVVAKTLRASRLAMFEIAPDDKTRIKPRMTGGPSLADALGPELWAHYRELVGDAVAAKVEHASIEVAAVVLVLHYDDVTGGSLDHQLQDLATSSHVPTAGLELASFQDHLLEDTSDLRALRESIESFPDGAALRKHTVDELDSYCRGDRMTRDTRDDDLMRAHGYSAAEIAALNDKLIFSRNRAWVPTLEKLFDQGDVSSRSARLICAATRAFCRRS